MDLFGLIYTNPLDIMGSPLDIYNRIHTKVHTNWGGAGESEILLNKLNFLLFSLKYM